MLFIVHTKDSAFTTGRIRSHMLFVLHAAVMMMFLEILWIPLGHTVTPTILTGVLSSIESRFKSQQEVLIHLLNVFVISATLNFQMYWFVVLSIRLCGMQTSTPTPSPSAVLSAQSPQEGYI